jgi:hypothetical protein
MKTNQNYLLSITNYTLMSCYRNAGEKEDIYTANRYFKDATNFR